jgi:hypothetical protein
MTTRYYENYILKSTASKGNNFDLLNRYTLKNIIDNKVQKIRNIQSFLFLGVKY